MLRLKLVLTLSTFCFLAASCATADPHVVPLNVKAEHPERFVCERRTGDNRPAIPPAYVVDWSRVQTVDQARSEHDSYVRSIVDRNGVISGYIVTLEGVNFTCWNNMEWQRHYYDALPPTP